MRNTYRSEDNHAYWTKRWDSIPADIASVELDRYPTKYAIRTIGESRGKILEAGCGAGRVLRFFHDKGYDIHGFDFVETAVAKLKSVDDSLNVSVGDIRNLNYSDHEFDFVLAFGLYHNLSEDLGQAIQETVRVLKKDGRLCASFRADNLQTRISDLLADYRSNKVSCSTRSKVFHKMNLTKNELVAIFSENGIDVETVEPVVNMPIFYKFRIFRSETQKNFNEHSGRVHGYQLSKVGRLIQKLCMVLAPNQFCNIYLLTGKPL